jgi:hypothetical protein
LIQVSRSIIRQFRTAMKKSMCLHCVRGVHPPVVMQAGSNGFTIHTQHNGLALSYHMEGSLPEGHVMLPAKALDEIEGRDQGYAELECIRPSTVLARWTDHDVPRVVEYEVPGNGDVQDLPALPKQLAPIDSQFLKALDDAMHVVATMAVRYATDKVQLRGSDGAIAATDGGQMLWQSGFQFPWKEDVLVPHVKLFGCSDFFDQNVSIGKTDTHVCIRSGHWTVLLPIDKEGRFPKVENVIPKMNDKCSRLRLDPSDSAFLARTLPRLPGNEGHAPVTLDLNGHVAIRARGEEQERATAVTLTRSSVSGHAIRYATNRGYLARAVALGFSEIQFNNVESPALCQDDRSKYIFMGLGKTAVIEPSDNELRLASEGDAAPSPSTTERTTTTVKTTSPPVEQPAPVSNDHAVNGEHNTENGQHKASFGSLLEDAQSLQNALRDMLLRTNHMISGLKHYHRTTKAMRSTLASLRQLQQLEV